MEKIMDIPKNCQECKHNKDCRSYYGGSLCKHGKEINKIRRKTP